MGKTGMYTSGYLRTMIAVTAGVAAAVGFILGGLQGADSQVSQPVSTGVYVTPTGSVAPTLPATEDGAGWDCRVQGNRVCPIRGELWLNLSHLPSAPFARCLLALDAVSLDSGVAGIASPEVCEPLYVNG